ncbi:MAG: helix-turn-helix domain-containing protein [Armatimonadota bacterium]
MQSWLEELLEQSLRVEVLSGDVTPIGAHTTGWRVLPGMVIACLRPGHGRLALEDGSIHDVQEGTAVAVPGGMLHRIDIFHPRCISRWVHVNFYVLGKLDLLQLLDLPPVIPPPRSEKIGAAIEEWTTQRDGWLSLGSLYARVKQIEFGLRLLGYLLEEMDLRDNAGRQLARIHSVWPAIEYMHTHYQEPLYRDILQHRAKMSTAKFHRMFRQALGATPMEYLRGIRMRHAQEQLIASSLTVMEIARRVGYEDPFVFSKAFKRYCGMNPRAYQKATRDLAGEDRGKPRHRFFLLATAPHQSKIQNLISSVCRRRLPPAAFWYR